MFVTETGTDTGMINGDRFVPLDFCPEATFCPSSCDKKIVEFQCKYCACHNNTSVNVSTSVEVDACESCSSFVPTAS